MNYDTEIQIHKNSVGSKTKLQESLIEAMQILYNGFINNEQISKTLECRIESYDSNNDTYTVDYMGNRFTKVECHLNDTYIPGDIVFVLIPNGDFSKTKTIVGRSEPD